MIISNRVVDAGGSLSPDGPDRVAFNVSGVPESRRGELRHAIQSGLERHRLPAANLRLRFDDGSVMLVASDSREDPR